MKLITLYHNTFNSSNATHYRDTYYGWSSTRRLRVRILNINKLPSGAFTKIIRSKQSEAI